MTEKIWFITGTSRGFGREWAIAALERGDRVAATARDTATLDDLVEKYGDALLPIQLDVTDRDADFAAVKQAHDHFGRLDVVVNNAGYGQFGFIEELTEQEARDQIETNLFGALWVTQAALPFLRAQGSRATSSRCRRSAGSPRSRTSASTTRRSGRSRASSQALAQEVESLRHPRDADRAGRLLHRLGRSVGQALRAAAGYNEVHEEADRKRSQRASSRAIRRRRRRPCSRSSTPPSRHCGCSSARAARHRQGRLREPPQDMGGVAARRRRGPGLSV